MMNSQSPHKPHSRGAALIAILWIVAILSIAVFSSTQLLFVELESDSNDASLFQAEFLADRGIAIASHSEITQGDPALSQKINETGGFETRISSAGDRLNINAILYSHQTDRIVLESLFTAWGLRSDESTDVVDNLIDWTDGDDLPTMVGAEKSYYTSIDRPHHPYNRPFQSVKEIALVKDFEKVMRINPKWERAFTFLSSGKLDLNEAPAELIAAACECSVEVAQIFVEGRAGFDGAKGTEDDIIFDDITEALSQLGATTESLPLISSRVGLDDPIQRIISIGRYGGLAVERSVSIQYSGATGKILEWSSRRIE